MNIRYRAYRFVVAQEPGEDGPMFIIVASESTEGADLHRRAAWFAEQEFGLGTNDKFQGPVASYPVDVMP